MKKITIARGDGIGPEIMDAVLKIVDAADVQLEFEEIEIGEKVYKSGNSSGISAESWEKIRRNKIFLKAPITTPQGGGYKSLNVTTRKALNLFANVRPCRSFHPYVRTKHPKLDIVVVRENEEDLYAGIEHQQTQEVVQCLKLISRPGCEKIVRYAFEYAKLYGRKKVTCLTKDNIMKQTDGLFHQVFKEIAPEYPEIQSEHMIIDIGTARLADTPEFFDVIVVPNLYGDIISDVVAQITGSVGLAGSSNIGEECAMFEAIHGSAPDIAGKNIANPSGLLQATVMMLNHVGESEAAELIQNAWLKTLESGIHTADIYREDISTQKVSTRGFAEAVIAHLGQKPTTLSPVQKLSQTTIKLPKYIRREQPVKELMGVDVFVDWSGADPEVLAKRLQAIETPNIKLSMITNRGIKVWPNGFSETFCTDHWRCRYESTSDQFVDKKEIVELLTRADEKGIDTIKTENLYRFDGNPAFSLGQGQ
jgi:isocitrate dehydrogenase